MNCDSPGPKYFVFAGKIDHAVEPTVSG
jgi:hypothetical protein